MYESCLEKQRKVKELFASCQNEEMKYEKIIELGKQQARLDEKEKTAQNFVPGCQSQMYLRSYLRDGKMFFEADSDALISFGLAAILIKAYNGEDPETVLKCPPTYLEELGIGASLTPSRANGLYSIHLRMKQDALKLYMQSH